MTTKSWWKRTSTYLASHSNLLVVTGGLVGGAYILSQYAISKFQQVQEKLVQDKNAKENLRRRFAQNQEDCTFTVLALLPTLGEQLFTKLNVEQLTESLRTQPTPLVKPDSAAYSSETEGSIPPSLAVGADGPAVTSNGTMPLSPQLNPLAKSFVPGGASTQDTKAALTDAQPLQTTRDPPEEVPQTTSTQQGDSQPSSITINGSAPTTHHVDAQEQRNKILAERQAKLRLWNQLKTTAFARTVTSMYCVVLLTLQTHIQLNLIGRFAYLSSVQAQALEVEAQQQDSSFGFASDPQASFQDRFGLDHETERLYLTFSWWFLHQGWDRLSDRVSNAIEKVLSPLSVKAQLSMADLKALLGDARTIIEHDLSNADQDPSQAWKRANFLGVLFPSTIEEEAAVLTGAGACTADDARLILRTNAKLRALLDETKDIIESDDFSTILRLCIDRVFEVLYNSLSPSFGIQQTGLLDTTASDAFQSRFQELTDEMQVGNKIRLASLFPVVTRQSQMAIHGVPNEYTENLAESKELRAFSAVIYAAWSQI